jgi:GH24 family phage-related lysozyme (muramidase)
MMSNRFLEIDEDLPRGTARGPRDGDDTRHSVAVLDRVATGFASLTETPSPATDRGPATDQRSPVRTVSTAGIDLMKRWESFHPRTYDDADGDCAIGFGSVLHAGRCDGRSVEVRWPDGISETQARELVAQQAAEAAQVLTDTVSVPLNQNQIDALASFVSNVGAPSFQQSTLLRMLNDGNLSDAAAEIRKWTKARENGGLVDLPELVKRREAEATLFQAPTDAPGSAVSQSFTARLVRGPAIHSSTFESPSRVMRHPADTSPYSATQQVEVAGMALGDALQVGLAGVAIVQAQASASQGTFTLTYDKAQRLITDEARAKMPGSQRTKQTYSRLLLYLGIGAINVATANVIIEWEGNPYGEIGTPVIRRDLATSTEFSKSSANIAITKVDRIPKSDTDPRSWPITYSYEGTYDPYGNGYFEFYGEFEINAFGGLHFIKHDVFTRSTADWAIGGTPYDKVQRGAENVVPVPPMPEEQIQYLRTRAG